MAFIHFNLTTKRLKQDVHPRAAVKLFFEHPVEILEKAVFDAHSVARAKVGGKRDDDTLNSVFDDCVYYALMYRDGIFLSYDVSYASGICDHVPVLLKLELGEHIARIKGLDILYEP